jgi:hypothetical protein
VEGERNPNAPTRRQGVPRTPARRHYAALVTAKSVRRSDDNTVIMPWVDVQADVQAIAEGRAVRDGNAFTVNGRTYVLKERGRLFPRDGDGFYRLTRSTYRALSLYNDRSLDSDPDTMLDLERIPEADRVVARAIKRELDEWRRSR